MLIDLFSVGTPLGLLFPCQEHIALPQCLPILEALSNSFDFDVPSGGILVKVLEMVRLNSSVYLIQRQTHMQSGIPARLFIDVAPRFLKLVDSVESTFKNSFVKLLSD